MLPKNFLVVGLTGGLASGKSLVSDLFSSKGINILDADIIVRRLHQDPTIQNSIRQQFGDLNRQALRELVFNDTQAKQWLEQLLQPLVLAQISEWQLPSNNLYGVLVAPLLIETGLHHQVDQVLVVDCDLELQLLRASKRDQMSADLAARIIAQQVNREQRLQHAHDIILNNGSIHQLDAQVEQLHQQYVQLAKQNYP